MINGIFVNIFVVTGCKSEDCCNFFIVVEREITDIPGRIC